MRQAVVAIVGGMLLLVVSTDPTQAQSGAPRYRMLLDERHPLVAEIELFLPGRDDMAIDLRLRPQSDGSFASPPVCDRGRLETLGAEHWRADGSCGRVRWSVPLDDQSRAGLDAGYPVGAWDGDGRWWIVTSRLGWLMSEVAPSDARLEVKVRDAQNRITRYQFVLRGPEHVPFYAVLSPQAPTSFNADEIALDVFGKMPSPVRPDLLRSLAGVWSGWRRDLLPDGARAPARIALTWTHPPSGSEPGFVASAGSDAVVMHYLAEPGVADADAKWRAGMILIGGHEGFHSLLGALPQRWPTWVNESWASYFAYRAVRERTDSAALALADELVQQPVAPGLLAVQSEQDQGDSSNYAVFYSKGARFWQAIDAVLVTRDSPSGRLAALIRDSDAFAEVDWTDPDSLAAFLDARSNGRAGALVSCYLVETGCG
jgi:hypothetical protein